MPLVPTQKEPPLKRVGQFYAQQKFRQKAVQRVYVAPKPPIIFVSKLVPLRKAQVWVARVPKRKQFYAVVKKRVALVKNAQKQRAKPKKRERVVPKKVRAV